MAGDEKIIAQTFTDYIQAFQTLNPRAVLSHCAVPCVFISPQGVVVMINPMEIEILAGRMMENLKARGYGWSELADLRVSQMSDTIAFVSVSKSGTKPTNKNWNGLARHTLSARAMAPGRLRWQRLTMRIRSYIGASHRLTG